MKHLLEEPGRNRLSLGDRLRADRLVGMVERKIHGSNNSVGRSKAHLHLRVFRWGFMDLYTLRATFLSSKGRCTSNHHAVGNQALMTCLRQPPVRAIHIEEPWLASAVPSAAMNW